MLKDLELKKYLVKDVCALYDKDGRAKIVTIGSNFGRVPKDRFGWVVKIAMEMFTVPFYHYFFNTYRTYRTECT